MPRSARQFSAKLLFQFRVSWGRKSNLRRVCEERVVTFKAQSAERAWKTANRLGAAADFEYRNPAGSTVHFEYVGIMELLELGVERSGPEEVWYDIVERLKPSERKSLLIPRKRALQAFAGISLRQRAPRPRPARSRR
jgi:hypothetical protein